MTGVFTECLRLVQVAINYTWQPQATPLELPCLLNFGTHRCLRTLLTLGFPSACGAEVQNPAAGELAVNMQHLTPRAKKFMFAAQQRQKHSYDISHSEAAYEVEAQLILSTVGIWLTGLTTGTEKLQFDWLGALECTERNWESCLQLATAGKNAHLQ